MEVSDFLLTKCVWGMGMLQVIFNTEPGNYYSNSTFIMTLIKQEKLILYIQEYLGVFTKQIMGDRVSEDFQFRVSSSRNNRKCTDLNAINFVLCDKTKTIPNKKL